MPTDRCTTCGKDRQGSMFECPHCGNMPDKPAKPLLENTLQDDREMARNQAAINKHMIIGTLIFVAGIFISLGSYLYSQAFDSPSFLLAYGAIIGGSIDFLYGLKQNLL